MNVIKFQTNQLQGYAVSDQGTYSQHNVFPTIEALENHIKLMLIAVQNYKEKPVE